MSYAVAACCHSPGVRVSLFAGFTIWLSREARMRGNRRAVPKGLTGLMFKPVNIDIQRPETRKGGFWPTLVFVVTPPAQPTALYL